MNFDRNYDRKLFDARNAENVAQKQQELLEDMSYQRAKSALEKAQAELDNITEVARSQPTMALRLAYNPNIQAAKAAIVDAEKACYAARNDFYRSMYLVRLEEARAVQEREQEQAQNKHAAEQEAIAKKAARPAFLQAGGTVEQFEAAWPSLWAREVEERVHASTITVNPYQL